MNTDQKTYIPFSSRLHNIFLTSKSRPRVWVVLLFAIYFLYAGLSFIFLPKLVEKELTSFVLQDLKSQARFERISYNPFTFTLAIHNLSLPYPESEEIFISAERLSLSPGILRLIRMTPAIGHLHIKNPVVNMSLSKEGHFSPLAFAELFPPEEASTEQPAEEPGIFPFVINDLSIEGGVVNFIDHMHDTKLLVEHLNISLPFASSLDSDRAVQVEPSLAATANGMQIKIEGSLTPFDEELRAEFNIRTKELALQTLQPYLSPYTNLNINSGEASTAIVLRFSKWQEGLLDMGLAGKLSLRDVEIKDKNDTTVMALPQGSLEISHMLMNLDEVVVSKLLLDQPTILVTRESDGLLNWQNYFITPQTNAANSKPASSAENSPATASTPKNSDTANKPLADQASTATQNSAATASSTQNASSPAAPSTQKPADDPERLPTMVIKNLDLRDANIVWQDKTLSKPTKVEFTPLNLVAENIKTNGKEEGHFLLTLGNYSVVKVGAETASDIGNVAEQLAEKTAEAAEQANKAETLPQSGASDTPAASTNTMQTAAADGKPAQPAEPVANDKTPAPQSASTSQAPMAQTADKPADVTLPSKAPMDQSSSNGTDSKEKKTEPTPQIPASEKPAATAQQEGATTTGNAATSSKDQDSSPQKGSPAGSNPAEATIAAGAGKTQTPETVINEPTVSSRDYWKYEKTSKQSSFGGIAIAGSYVPKTSTLVADIKSEEMPLQLITPYLEAAGVKLQSGFVHADFQIRAENLLETPSITTPRGSIALKKFQANYTGDDQTTVDVKTSNLSIGGVSLSVEGITVGSIALDQPGIELGIPASAPDKEEPKAKGAAASKPTTPQAKPAASQSKPGASTATKNNAGNGNPDDFTFTLKSLRINNGSVRIINQAEKSLPLELGSATIEINDFSTAPSSTLKLTSAATWNKTGSTVTTGKGTLTPLNISLTTELKNIPIVSLSPWIRQFSSARIASGVLNGDLTTQIAEAGIAVTANLSPAQAKRAQAAREKYARDRKEYAQSTAAARFGIGIAIAGKANISNLVVNDKDREVLNLPKANLYGMSLNTAAQTYDIGRISLSTPRVSINIFPDHSNSIGRLFMSESEIAALAKAPQPAQQPEPTPAKAPEALNNTAAAATASKVTVTTKSILPDIARLSLNSLKVENAQVRIIDDTFTTRSIITVSDLNIGLEGLSTEHGDKATFNVRGLVEGAAFSMEGKGTPLRQPLIGNTDIVLQDMDMRPISGYAERFLGYPVDKGILFLKTNLETDGINITGKLRIKTNNLTLGGKVSSDEATHQPVKLGLSLLADKNGVITIDVPINGKLSDPDFRTGAVIGKGLRNLVGKVITSPFSLLGSIFSGGKEKNLQQVSFTAGDYRVSKSNVEVLKAVIKLMQSKSKLNLVLKGVVDQEEQSHMGRAAIRRAMQQQIWEDMPRKERAEVNPVDIPWDLSKELANNPERFHEILLAAYAEQKFPNAPAAKTLRSSSSEQIMATFEQQIAKDEKAMEDLARARAQAVLDEILTMAPKLENRVSIDPTPGFRQSKAGQPTISQVEFGLSQ